MRYVIADIHGCFQEYKELLKKIDFSDDDELFVLGDAIDRGPEPINVLLDLMSRPNATLLMGNHECLFFFLMKKLAVEITEDNFDVTVEIMKTYNSWIEEGGAVTAEQFKKLSKEEKEDILDYVSDAPVYMVLEQEEKEYILVHAGLGNFALDKTPEECELHELLEKRVDYSKRYFSDKNKYLVTGHTPTVFIKGWEKPEVYINKGHIALDCGCVGGGRLAVYCIETKEVTYVDKI